MSYHDRDPPLTRDEVEWRNAGSDSIDDPYAFFFPSGFAWYFDADGQKRDDLTKYGWTGIRKLVEVYGASRVTLQYGLDGLPYITSLAPVLEQLREPTEFNRIGGMAGTGGEELPPDWPEAWLWLNGEAWYFDERGTPIPEDEALGWQGLHGYLDRYTADNPPFRFRLAASVRDTSVVDPGCAALIREMVREPP